MIQSQILRTKIIRIVQQTVRRITNKILEVKGLRDQSIFIIGRGGDEVRGLWLCHNKIYLIPH